MGHISCIIQAANLCDELYIVLSTGYKRGEISFRVRYRWIYRLTKHIGNVKILSLTDSTETKADYTREYWMADTEYCSLKGAADNPVLMRRKAF